MIATEDIRPEGQVGDPKVCVILTTYNYSRFLGQALESVLAQTVAPGRIIVIDDGSDDDPAEVVARYPGVDLVVRDHHGTSHARNVGLKMANTKFVVFLDGDDVLLPQALEHGLACMANNPGAGFVYGAYQLTDANLQHESEPMIRRARPRAFLDLLRYNVVRMQSAVMYDRQTLVDVGGFDEDIPRCEDYELYLRIASRHRVASHTNLVAKYRLHGSNISSHVSEMLDWHNRVLDMYRPDSSDRLAMEAWLEGKRYWRSSFSNFVWKDRGSTAVQSWRERARMLLAAPSTTMFAAFRQLVIKMLPGPIAASLRRVRRRWVYPPRTDIDFGDLARLKPVGSDFGFHRGRPVDRYYIERFLDRHRQDITGNVLEVGDPDYTQRFGTALGTVDVLNVRASDPGTTIAGDLCDPATLKPESFDCIIMTQALQYMFDLKAAVTNLRTALRPGGVALVTAPAISPIDQTDWEWYWTFNDKGVQRLFSEVFGEENLEITTYGNAFAATCFIQGVAVEDVGTEWLDPSDRTYPVSIVVRAVKPA